MSGVGSGSARAALTYGTASSAGENGAARNAGWRGMTGGPGEQATVSWARKEGGARGELGHGVGAGAGAERKREPGRGNGPRGKGREGERMGCWAAGKGSGPPGLGCLGWAGEKGRREQFGPPGWVWAFYFLSPFLFYF